MRAKIGASRYLENTPIARPTRAWALFSELLRSFQSLSLMKARPAFWPWPLKEKPLTVKTESTAAFSSLRKRSEEHTSELQSLMRISYAVFCLKKTKER